MTSTSAASCPATQAPSSVTATPATTIWLMRCTPGAAHGLRDLKGISDNQRRRAKIARDGLRLARCLRDHQDMILRFATGLAVGFASNQADYAERDVRPVKVRQRTSGGAWLPAAIRPG